MRKLLFRALMLAMLTISLSSFAMRWRCMDIAGWRYCVFFDDEGNNVGEYWSQLP